MGLRESGAYCHAEEDKEAASKRFTQCSVRLDTHMQYRAAKWDTGPGGCETISV